MNRRLLALALVPLGLGACKSWEPATGTSLRSLDGARPSSVRVTTVDGTQVTLKSPLVVNDSIVSAVAPPLGAVVIPPRRGVLEDDVNLLEVARFDKGRTIALTAVLATAAITWARVQGAGGGGEERPDPLPKNDPAFDLVTLVRLVVGWF